MTVLGIKIEIVVILFRKIGGRSIIMYLRIFVSIWKYYEELTKVVLEVLIVSKGHKFAY